MLVVNLSIEMLKQESILPLKMDLESDVGMEINITLCSRAAVLSRQVIFIVLNKGSHNLSSAS